VEPVWNGSDILEAVDLMYYNGHSTEDLKEIYDKVIGGLIIQV
jgi:hypothetical protein